MIQAIAEQDRHTHTAFDEDLAEVRALIGEMGGLALSAIERALYAVTQPDPAVAEAVAAGDAAIDALQAQLETSVVRTMALRAPMADDLRSLVAAIKIGALLERAGDHAKGIARQSGGPWNSQGAEAKICLAAMGRHAAAMLRDAVAAYETGDRALATAVRERDPDLNLLYAELKHRLLERMRADADFVEGGATVLMIGKKLERVGDYASNISDCVHYMLTGRHFPDCHAPAHEAEAA